MICKNCGVLLGEGHEICPRCGAPVAAAETFERTPTRHENDPWKRPAKRVSTLPPEPRGRSSYAAREGAPVHAPETRTQRTIAARSASRPENRRDEPEHPVRPADERPSSVRRERPDGARSASRPRRSAEESAHAYHERIDSQRHEEKDEKIRMVKRHKYRAIEPELSEYASVNWIFLLVAVVFSVLVLAVGGYVLMTQTEWGAKECAKRGWDTNAKAYHQAGREFMNNGSISKALYALEVAQTKEPDDLEILIDLGRAYTAVGRTDRAELAYMHAIKCWPSYPESYRYLIEIMLDDKRNYEALQCIELAIEETEDSYFTTLMRQIKPATPSVSVLGGSFAEEFELSISAAEGAKIYYTMLDQDPTLEGTLYTGPIYLEEGSWRIRAVAVKDGMFSDVNAQSYIINKPSPDAPKATLAPDTYDSVRTVSLRVGKDVVAVYYTMDGTAPTTESKLYEGPITLRVGKTTLRAIAVNADGKKSNEMVVEYECKGNAGTSFKESDTIDKLALNSTTRSKFISAYGEPNSEQDDGEDELGVYTRLNYAWGYATFLDRQNGKESVLVELSTNTPQMKGPRSTGIGMRVEDVVSAFRDVGGEENARGIRNLYTLTTGAIGILTRVDEDDFHIGYYYKLDSGAWLELSYYSEGGLIVRMEWLWYMAA